MKIADVIQSADWKAEKHAPMIDCPDRVKAGEKVVIGVAVGQEIAHPNTTEHHINWLKLYFKADNGKFVCDLGSYEFNAHGAAADGSNKGPAYTEPWVQTAVKLSESGTLIATAYCNIHGLWESAKKVTIE